MTRPCITQFPGVTAREAKASCPLLCRHLLSITEVKSAWQTSASPPRPHHSTSIAGNTPAQLFRIASSQPLAAEFLDTGLSKQLIPPADPNFEHANFYWRLEQQTEASATIHTPSTIGNDGLQMAGNRYRGMTARITRGRGAGEERSIMSNTTNTLTLSPVWTVEPDATSFFVVAENGLAFGALPATSSPVQFDIPNRAGETVQLSGRAANPSDVEIVRRTLDGHTVADRRQWGNRQWRTAGARVSALALQRLVVSSSLAASHLPDFENTHTISSGTLAVHYRDELAGPSPISLATAAATCRSHHRSRRGHSVDGGHLYSGGC